jgi:hypothetical protein
MEFVVTLNNNAFLCLRKKGIFSSRVGRDKTEADKAGFV